MDRDSETIQLTAPDGSLCTFYVEDQTRLNGRDYLLVADAAEGDANAYIFKDVSDETSAEAVYEQVTDEGELEALMKIFAEMLDDTDLII